jgi:hypothetical protein
MAVIYSKWPKNIPNLFPFQCPPKFTQIGIFGLKIYHLATPELPLCGVMPFPGFYDLLNAKIMSIRSL